MVEQIHRASNSQNAIKFAIECTIELRSHLPLYKHTMFKPCKILLIGKNGQVGWELRRALAPLGEVVAVGSQELDLTQADRIRSIVDELRPQLIVNAAAYTAVDKAESEPEVAMAINGVAPGILAEAAGKCGASLIPRKTRGWLIDDAILHSTQSPRL